VEGQAEVCSLTTWFQSLGMRDCHCAALPAPCKGNSEDSGAGRGVFGLTKKSISSALGMRDCHRAALHAPCKGKENGVRQAEFCSSVILWACWE